MSRVILLLVLLGIAHDIVWGFHHHHHHSGPYSSGPDSSGPDSSGPDSSGPDSSGPDSSGPDSSGPDSSGPDSSGPDSSGPDSSGPDSSGPDSSGPDSSGPNSSGPDSSGPNSSGPDSHDSHHCGHGEHHRHNYTWHSQHDTRFKKLSDYIIRADRFYKELCDRFTPNNVQESRDFIYSLEYLMPQMDPKNIAVKIKHRVMYMYARQSDSKDSPTYVDVKILPDALKISDAFWRYDEDKLTINIPYDKDLILKPVKRCDNVDVDIKDVPQKSGLIYKFGSENYPVKKTQHN